MFLYSGKCHRFSQVIISFLILSSPHLRPTIHNHPSVRVPMCTHTHAHTNLIFDVLFFIPSQYLTFVTPFPVVGRHIHTLLA